MSMYINFLQVLQFNKDFLFHTRYSSPLLSNARVQSENLQVILKNSQRSRQVFRFTRILFYQVTGALDCYAQGGKYAGDHNWLFSVYHVSVIFSPDSLRGSAAQTEPVVKVLICAESRYTPRTGALLSKHVMSDIFTGEFCYGLNSFPQKAVLKS